MHTFTAYHLRNVCFVEERACVLAEPGQQCAYVALGSWAPAWQLTAHPVPASAQQGPDIVQGRAGPAEWAGQVRTGTL